MDTYAYMFGENLYINLTNRCCNDCTFCLRNDGDGVGEDNLWLSKEPKAHEVIAAVARFAPSSYRDVVFCGYGEPTYALDVMREVADYVHGIGKQTRLNTNGLGNVIQGKDIVPQLKGKIDTVSVSLNDCSAEKYDEVSPGEFALVAGISAALTTRLKPLCATAWPPGSIRWSASSTSSVPRTSKFAAKPQRNWAQNFACGR